jgi:GTP-binding protein Era
MPVRGILVAGLSQVVLVDTPGIFAPRRRLDRAMVEAAWAGAGDADAVVLVVDAARGISTDVDRVLERLASLRGRRILALNKVDRVAGKEALLALAADLSARSPFDRVFMIDALHGAGVGDLGACLAGAMPEGPWHYPDDEVSDLSERRLAAEITRERLYHRLHEELPYAATVETTAWSERKDGSVRIEQTIFIERESQRRIVLGRAGATVKQISIEARRELSRLIARPVHLFLFVKVRENWGDDPERYREMGLDFPSD